MIPGHNFYHTFNKGKTTSPVTASITTIYVKEETESHHPMIKILKRICPSDPDLINRLKQIINPLDNLKQSPYTSCKICLTTISNYHSPGDIGDPIKSLFLKPFNPPSTPPTRTQGFPVPTNRWTTAQRWPHNMPPL